MSHVTVIIPARFQSTRLPGKPLLDIGGHTMIYHVYQRARQATLVDDVVVATDDQRIEKAVQAFGGQVILTSPKHSTGTDRIAEVAQRMNSDIIINVQGDEVGVHPESIDAMIQPLLSYPDIQVANLIEILTQPNDLLDINVVKVVIDTEGFILFYSRSPIPYPRTSSVQCFYRQVGLYAFRKQFLLEYAMMSQTPLELIEGVEFLRLVENGHRIKAVVSQYPSFDVDTYADLLEARKRFTAPL